jgi:hypothetical protein
VSSFLLRIHTLCLAAAWYGVPAWSRAHALLAGIPPSFMAATRTEEESEAPPCGKRVSLLVFCEDKRQAHCYVTLCFQWSRHLSISTVPWDLGNGKSLDEKLHTRCDLAPDFGLNGREKLPNSQHADDDQQSVQTIEDSRCSSGWLPT